MTCLHCGSPERAAGLCGLHQHRKLHGEPMIQPHDLVGEVASGHGLLGVVERDETGVMCHECGRWLGGLGWHIVRVHGMSVAEYRTVHGLPAGVPLVSLGASAAISSASAARVGSPGWLRFEGRRDATMGESVRAAAQAAAHASVGTSAARARQASAQFSGRGDRLRDEDRWRANLGDFLRLWAANGRTPRQTAEDLEERRLARWMSHQWRAIAAGSIAAGRLAALVESGVPVGPDGVRGRKWASMPPPDTPGKPGP